MEIKVKKNFVLSKKKKREKILKLIRKFIF